MKRVKTPCHVILRDPLLKVLTSLRGYLSNLRCFSEVNLQPLVVIVVLGWPGPHVPSPSSSVETGQKRGMVPIPLRWWRNPVVLDSACLHSHWTITKSSYWHQKGVFSKTFRYDYCRSSMFYTFLAFLKMVLQAINVRNSLKQSILHESTNWGRYFYFFYWRRDRHFTLQSEPREGLAVCRAMGVPSFLSYFKTLSIGRTPGIEPTTCRSAVKHSTDWANPAATNKMNNLLLTSIACKYHAHYNWCKCLRCTYTTHPVCSHTTPFSLKSTRTRKWDEYERIELWWWNGAYALLQSDVRCLLGISKR